MSEMSGKVYVQWFMIIKGEGGNGKRRGRRGKGSGEEWEDDGGKREEGWVRGKWGRVGMIKVWGGVNRVDGPGVV